MWIGVISDTQSVLPREALDVFRGVNYILHCGNIGGQEVVDELSHLAPVAGVLGANDDPAVHPFERTLFRRWNRIGIFMSHRIGDPMDLPRGSKKEIERFAPSAVLFGHEPASFNSRVDGRLFFSPGMAGARRRSVRRSVGLLEIDGTVVRAEVVPIDR